MTSNTYRALGDRVSAFYHAHINTTRDNQARKVALEAEELVTSGGDDLEEAADVLISLLSWTFARGIDPRVLLDKAHEKMAVNELRKWAKTADGEVRHV